jgi:hypothetical protein
MEELDLYKVFNEFIDRYDFRPHQIPGYPDYSVDRFGKVYDRFGNDITPYKYPNQYDMMYLTDPYGNHRVYGVHQLVAMTFNDKWFDGCIVHHLDEDKHNNYDYNLECMSREEHGRLHNAMRTDKIAICQVCGRPFVWTAQQQGYYDRDITRHKERFITCSKSCSSYIGRLTQLGKPFNPLPIVIKDIGE